MTGEVRSLPTTPSAIVVLGEARLPPLTYNEFGRLESQVALTAAAFATTQRSATTSTPDTARDILLASASSFAQADLAIVPTTPNLIGRLASPPTVATLPDFVVTPLPFVPGATTPPSTLEPPVTADLGAALSNTFNPLIPVTPDITPLDTSRPVLPTTLTGVIVDTGPTLAGAPSTATFALPPPIAAARPAAAEAEATIPLTAGTTAIAPPGPPVAEGPAAEGAATAAPLTSTALADTRIVTPEPTATTTPATAQTETVLTALSASRESTVIAAPNAVSSAPAATSADALTPAVPVAADAVTASAAPTTAPATPGAPSVPGAAIPGVADVSAVPAQVPSVALEAGILTPDDIVTNPFYPAMAASLYLSAMSFRMQQSSSAELNGPAENVQMVGSVRAVTGVQFDRQGPADDFRNMTRTFA